MILILVLPYFLLIFLNFPGITKFIEKINANGLEGFTCRLLLDSHIFILRLGAINMSKISSSYLTSSDALLEWKLLHDFLMKWSHHLISGQRYTRYLLSASAFSGLFLAILQFPVPLSVFLFLPLCSKCLSDYC